MEKQATLQKLADLFDWAKTMETDWVELAKEQPISNIQDSREVVGI